MTEITLKLTFEELKIIDKYVELNDETRPLFDKIRNAYPKLYTAVRCADAVIDIWAGMNLKQIKEEAEAYIRGIEDYEEEPYQE